MTNPRRIVAGTTYLITRRCAQRQMLLDPNDRAVAALFRYLIAVYAARHNIAIHAVCVMSNHLHIVLTDVEGRLPDFCRDLFGLAARAINARTGHEEAVWNSDGVDMRELLAEQDVLDAMTYVMANPVHHGTVDCCEHWPGLLTRLADLGRSARPARPVWYFGRRSRLPARAEFHLERPAAFAELDETAWLELLERHLSNRLEDERREHGSQGAAPRRGVQLRRFTVGPRTVRGGVRPLFYSACPTRLMAAFELRHEFLRQYADALKRWRRGQRDVLFPHGTWLMRVLHEAGCAPPIARAQSPRRDKVSAPSS